MAIPRVTTIDLETKGIKRRPQYPPLPVSASIKYPGDRAPKAYVWGHPTGNNCSQIEGYKQLRKAWNSGELLFYNANFDTDVLETHVGCKQLPWHKIHDAMYLTFLNDPHARQLDLKSQAAVLLGMDPEERDLVQEWVMAHKKELEAKFGRFTPKEWGQHISEAPGGLVGPYVNGDVVRTERLFKHLYPKIVAAGMLEAYDRERELMPILLQNEREGMRINCEALAIDVKRYTEAKAKATGWLQKRLKAPSLNPDSPDEVVGALDRMGVVTQWNVTKGGKRSTAKKNLTVDMFNDKRVAQVLGYVGRLGTCLGTFMGPWIEMADANDRIHPSWNQTRGGKGGGTRTGRPSCRDPNLLNIPKVWDDKGDGYQHPTAIQLPPLPLIRGYVLPDDARSLFGHRDFNQQEFRLCAHFEDGKLMQAYCDNPRLDMHDFVRGEILDTTGLEFQRRMVKKINFGMLYGQGGPSLAVELSAPLPEVRALIAAQRRAIPGVAGKGGLNEGLKAAGRAGEAIRTLGGRLYYCEPPAMINGHMVTWEYKLLNYLMQGSAADFTKQAVIDYHNAPDREGRFIVTVYDEINSSMPKKTWKHEQQVLDRCMSQAMRIDVPMITDGKIGPNWGNLEKCK